MNIMHIIHAYRLPKAPTIWAFDDEKHGLHEEIFVLDASHFISQVVGPDVSKATLIFSTNDFPGSNAVLTFVHNDRAAAMVLEKGGTYRAISGEVSELVWLCPAMAFYLGDVAPKTIYGQITPATSE
jgi:hypothetical protein